MRWTMMSLALALACVSGCASVKSTDASTNHDAELDELALMMTGWFDSTEQAARDEDFYEIRLVMLPIWPERTDGRWLYIEQAVCSALDRPYRQRVYHLHRNAEDGLVSDVYTLPGDPKSFTAAWLDPARFAELSPDQLDLRIGCTIELTRGDDGAYTGGTVGHGCSSSLGEASYATSIVTITPVVLVSWDQGWNEAGEQVWGAEKCGYEFVKHGDGPPPPRTHE